MLLLVPSSWDRTGAFYVGRDTHLLMHSIINVLSLCSTEKIPVLQAFSKYNGQKFALSQDNQLNLFDIPTGH